MSHYLHPDTRFVSGDQPDLIPVVTKLIEAGNPIVFPTDTVYGVGVTPFQAAAIEKLYELKGRSHDKGIPVLIADQGDLVQLVAESAQHLFDSNSAEEHPAQRWITTFWPGPLTLILPKRSRLPENLSPNDGIAVRMPNHTLARRIIRACGGALATTSANLSGRPPATTATEAQNALDGLVAAVIGPERSQPDTSGSGLPSTIVSLMGDRPQLIREGTIGVTDLGLD